MEWAIRDGKKKSPGQQKGVGISSIKLAPRNGIKQVHHIDHTQIDERIEEQKCINHTHCGSPRVIQRGI
jgi:hypothetical protein